MAKPHVGELGCEVNFHGVGHRLTPNATERDLTNKGRFMAIEGLENYTNDELIAELINRTTFAGVVAWHTGNVKQGVLEPGYEKLTKSPPLTRQGTELLLARALGLLPGMFDESSRR